MLTRFIPRPREPLGPRSQLVPLLAVLLLVEVPPFPNGHLLPPYPPSNKCTKCVSLRSLRNFLHSFTFFFLFPIFRAIHFHVTEHAAVAPRWRPTLILPVVPAAHLTASRICCTSPCCGSLRFYYTPLPPSGPLCTAFTFHPSRYCMLSR